MNEQNKRPSRATKVRGKKTGPSAKASRASEQKPSAETVTASPKAGASKQDKLIELLRRPIGATIEDLVEATGWQAHSVRGAMSGALKKKLKLTIESEKAKGQRRIYRIL